MPIDQEKLDTLLLLPKPAVAEIFRVEWSPDVWKYYAISSFDRILPFTDVKKYLFDDDSETTKTGIDARLVSSGFHSFELSADLRTEEIGLTFADSDDEIKELFRAHGDGARIELFYYYPQVDLFTSVWFGSLMQPDSFGRGNLQCKASNGFKSRELTIGRRTKPSVCPAVFGGKFTQINEYRGNLCDYNRQVGGSIGNLNGGVPFTECPKDEGACVARLGAHANGKARKWGGFNTEVQNVLTDAGSGYQAKTKGNTSQLKIPLRIIAGSKYVILNENLYFRKEINSSTPANGFVAGVWLVGEGENQLVDEVYVSGGDADGASTFGKRIEAQHLNTRTGTFGQSPTAYSPDISGFNCTSLVFLRYGWTNAASTDLSKLSVRARVYGYNKVRIYSDFDSFTQSWTNNRVWWLLELFTNMRFGLGYLHSRFDLESFVSAAEWVAQYVRFTDNFGNTYDHFRASFDAVIEPRTASDVLIDICRSGRISVPFQYDGKYTIQTLRPLTTDELNNVRVFSDKGDNRNIVWTEGAQSITLSKLSDKQLINHIELKYEDINKLDRERPLTVQDEDQKIRAGKAYGNGDSSPQDVPKNYVAFGCRNTEQAIKTAFAILNLGEFDSGGIKNNLSAQFTINFEQALGVKKFDVFKLESDLLEGEDFEYFRVMNMRKVGGKESNLVTITGQAYNHTYSTNLEVLVSGLPDPPDEPTETPTPTPNPSPCAPSFGTIAYNDADGLLSIPTNPC